MRAGGAAWPNPRSIAGSRLGASSDCMPWRGPRMILLRRHWRVMGCCCAAPPQPAAQMLLRFVEGRPVSAVTVEFLAWWSERLAAPGLTALVLIWDNASWHKSHAVRTWRRRHNQPVNATGDG